MDSHVTLDAPIMGNKFIVTMYEWDIGQNLFRIICHVCLKDIAHYEEYMSD